MAWDICTETLACPFPDVFFSNFRWYRKLVGGKWHGANGDWFRVVPYKSTTEDYTK